MRRPAAEQYRDWLATHVFTQNDAQLFQERIAGWVAPPRFHLALIQDDASTDALARSIHSLARQYYPHLTITVVARVPAPAGLSGEKMRWHEARGEDIRVANQALATIDADWFGLIRAGDEIAPHALLVAAEGATTHPRWDAMYSDEDRIAPDGTLSQPCFKPNFDIELLRATGYIGGLMLVGKKTWHNIGGWVEMPRGQNEFATSLRIAEHLPAPYIGHLADILYHRSNNDPALQAQPDEQLVKLVDSHLQRIASTASVTVGLHPGTVRISYPLNDSPRVSIIIPTKNQLSLLQRCVSSIFEQTDYPDFEVILVDNGSTDADAISYLAGIKQLGDSRLRVIDYDMPFNFSAMNNLAAREARGKLLLLLNNDTAVVHRDWLTNMVTLAQQPNVGAVGARLLYPDGSIQHAGIVLGLAGPAEHPFIGWPAEAETPFHLSHTCHQVSAVTAACMLVSRDLYLELGGMDEQAFKVSYNDVDFCLRLGNAGHRVLWTPYATLLHEGSASQNAQSSANTTNDPGKMERFLGEQERMYANWMKELTGDPAYNRNLGLYSRDYEIEAEPVLSWNPTPWRPLPRVLVYPADFTGSGEVRILAPRRALDKQLRIRGYASMRQLYPVEIAQADADAIIMQRPINPDRVKLLRDHKRYSRARCAVEIDDLISDIPPKSPHYGTIDKQALALFNEAATLADCLLVSTEPLAAAFSHLNPNVRVVPNYLDGDKWLNTKVTRSSSRRPRVGWSGSVSHAGDLQMIYPVVKALAKEVDWIFMGSCPSHFKPYVKEIHPAVSIADYPQALANLALDLAIAPLEINAFNEAKSHLKLLEYGALGYPVVCTDIEPYRGDFPVTRISNKPGLWMDAIRSHVREADEATKLGNKLREHILTHWLLEDHLDKWQEAWLS